MAKNDDSTGVSLSTNDGVDSGIFGPGPATIATARFTEFQYHKPGQKQNEPPRGAKANLLLVTYKREDEEDRRQPYGCGNGWSVGPKGLRLIPKNGQSGLPKTCNTFYLLESLEAAGMPSDWLKSVDQLDGLQVVLVLKPIERNFKDRDKDDKRPNSSSLLVIDEVIDPPWESGGKKKSKKKDDDDEDEAPAKGKKKPAADDDDDDDENEKPAKGKAAKGKKDDDDDDDNKDDDAEAVTEEAVETLIELLQDTDPIKVAKLEDLAKAALKGNPQKNVIAARCVEDDFLDLERGWSYDAKKGTVSAD